jgi:hypothetical protein
VLAARLDSVARGGLSEKYLPGDCAYSPYICIGSEAFVRGGQAGAMRKNRILNATIMLAGFFFFGG